MSVLNIGIFATYIILLLVCFVTFMSGLLSSPTNILSMGIGGGGFVVLCILPALIDSIGKKKEGK